MPRKTRKELVGKAEENEEIEQRDRFTAELEQIMHRDWQLRPQSDDDDELLPDANESAEGWDDESGRDANG